jgi:glycosyltransferase involved in cell wall biosynthesis
VLVSRLSAEKDIQSLIKAVPLVLQELPNFILRLVGDGACRPSLEKLTAQLSLGEHVQFAGETHEVWRELQRASMFVLPSLTEGVSLSLLEAMATGLPVVVTRVGGNVEVVEENRTGLLVDPGAPSELAQAMVALASDPALSQRLGLAGRQRVEAHFDVRSMVRAYERLYQDCLARKNGRRPAVCATGGGE